MQGGNNTHLSKPRELNTKGLSVILKDMVEIERPVLGHVSLFSDDRSSMINPVHHVNIRLVEEKRSNINSKQSLFPTLRILKSVLVIPSSCISRRFSLF